MLRREVSLLSLPVSLLVDVSYVPHSHLSVNNVGIRRPCVGVRSTLHSPVSLLDGEKEALFPLPGKSRLLPVL